MAKVMRGGLGVAGLTLLLGMTASTGTVQASDGAQQDIMQRYQQRQRAILEQIKQGVVRIEAQKETREVGAGIVLSSTPKSVMILTALHVVAGAQSISAVFYGDQTKRYTARKLPQHSTQEDLAMIEVDLAPGMPVPVDFPTYKFVANNGLMTGEHIWSANANWVMVPNTLTRLSHDGDPQRFEYSNVSVGEGFSGGPIFDDYMNVVGMHDALSGDGLYAIGVKIDSALQVLEALNYKVPKAGPQSMAVLSNLMGSGDGKPSACQKGCETALGSLKRLRHYAKPGGVATTEEDVYQLPAGWPGAGIFLHVIHYDYAGMQGMDRVNFAETDRPGDTDMMMGLVNLTGSTGQGFVKDKQSGTWTVTMRNPNFGGVWDPDALTIQVKSPF